MGYILNRTSSWPSQETTPALGFTPFLLLVLLFSCFFVIAVLLVHHAAKISRKNKEYHRYVYFISIFNWKYFNNESDNYVFLIRN